VKQTASLLLGYTFIAFLNTHSPTLSRFSASFLYHPQNVFSDILTLCYFLNVSDQASQPYKTTLKIIVLNILIFIFLDSKPEEKRLRRMIASNPRLKISLNFFMNGICFFRFIPTYVKCSSCQRICYVPLCC
jgi:hypothetical protein